MSSHAFFDSLSEDWPSQPPSPEDPKPPTDNGTAASSVKQNGTKIPRPCSSQGSLRKLVATPGRNSSIVLNERTPSDINIPVHSLKRTPSKLSRDSMRDSWRGHRASKSFNESPTGSIIHNTVHHRSTSSSPGKNKGNTPEWRRRLIYGGLAYGEQRDLFTSAATGLEGMFKPPVPSKTSPAQPGSGDEVQVPQNETVFPSSPPGYTHEYSNYETYGDPSSEQELPQQPEDGQLKHQGIRYRLNDEDTADFSQNSDMSVQRQPIRLATTDSSEISPYSKPLGVGNDRHRILSNQSTAQHEDFSPILIAKHSGEDGKIDFAPMDLSPRDLHQRLEKVQKSRDQTTSTSPEVNGSHIQSKSNNMEATEGLKQFGSFVNILRGGRSTDGSFSHLDMAPGIGNISDMLSEGSLQASTPKRFPSLRGDGPDSQASPPRTPSVPAAPFPSPDKKQLKVPAKGTSGTSPLKLFGAYDTFTNETLLRRISQFEDGNTSPSSERFSDGRKVSTGGVGPTAESASQHTSDPKKMSQHSTDPLQQPRRSLSQFGVGELDGYVFNEDFSRLSNESGGDLLLHRSTSFMQKSLSSTPAADRLVVKKRHQKANSTSPSYSMSRSPRSLSREMAAHAISLIATPTQQELLEYKRPRTSPSKDPTPKRRRTLHESDVAFGAEDDHFLELPSSQQQIQLPAGNKRKDARADDPRQTANPLVLASRQAPRPQTPTPKQKSPLQGETQSRDDSHFLQNEDVSPIQRPQQAQNPGLTAVGERKPSIKTEDFLNEAHRIMAAIRGKSGVMSGLTSVEESDEDHIGQDEAANSGDGEESTQEPFSRPPSREGKPIPRMARQQEDPKLVNHLKKYEEHSDMGDIHIIASSLRSLGISKEDIRAAQALEQNSHSSMSERSGSGVLENSEVVSDPPNIRISGHHNRYQYSTAAEQVQHFRDRFVSHGSGSESGYSTGLSVRTGSSRNSDTRKTIAPESVSHLIPDQVGGMVFDRQKNTWVKTKQAQPTRTKRSNTLLSENSEEDPFADIPDLTVDVSKELQNLRIRMAQQGMTGTHSAKTDKFMKNQTPPNHGSILKSILIKDFTDRQNKNSSMRSPSKLMRQFVEADDEDVEKEITMHDDRLDDSSPRRRGTVVFSSPISTVIQDMAAGRTSEEQDPSVIEQSPVGVPQPSERHSRRNFPFQTSNAQAPPRPRTSSSAPSRLMSLKGGSFMPRTVSVIEEQDEDSLGGKFDNNKELSLIGGQGLAAHRSPKTKTRQTSLNIVVTTPARQSAQPQPENAEILGHYVGNLSLSPLPDFTAHPEGSYAFEVSYVVGDQHLTTGDESNKRMSQTVRHLVDKIAEVEEFEPFWEDMKDIKLRDKRLGSLHMLDRFCGNLVKVDVSQNSLRTLDGLPSTVRELTISHNLLSDLTAWDRLANLQHVDVSNNEIKSLASFRNLVHLRDLIADNTGLVTLDGIKYHDSLLTLRVKGNAIEELDFEGTSLQKLQTLDLEGNKIRKIENLHELQSLSYLNLKGNQLVGFGPKEPLPLKQLIISDNKLRSLDLTMMRRLHLVYADRNKLTTVLGLGRVPHLDSLSLREQGGSKPFDMLMLSSAYEVRKLFLSGNQLGAFTLPRNFLNLQFLDLASCGLRSLPDGLGEMMPNLRVLNLNFNALSDVSGLLGIARLKRLHLAGNRFTDFKAVLKILSGLPWLIEADMRDTPLTQGFYPPVHMVVQRTDGSGASVDPFRLPDADSGRDSKFCRLLDMDTRIERRIYERKVVRVCKKLQKIDGLLVNKKVRHVKDTVWKAMVERGLLLRPDGSPFDLSNVDLEDEGPSSFMMNDDGSKGVGVQGTVMNGSRRWVGGEDNFA